MNQRKNTVDIAIVCISICLLAGCSSTNKPETSNKPLMGQLDRFTSADVPAMGDAEIAVPPRKPTTRPDPSGLPGNGLAQHPMLYVGEG